MLIFPSPMSSHHWQSHLLCPRPSSPLTFPVTIAFRLVISLFKPFPTTGPSEAKKFHQHMCHNKFQITTHLVVPESSGVSNCPLAQIERFRLTAVEDSSLATLNRPSGTSCFYIAQANTYPPSPPFPLNSHVSHPLSSNLCLVFQNT